MNYTHKILFFLLAVIVLISCEKDSIEDDTDNNNNNNQSTEVLAGADFEEWTTVSQGEVSFEKPAGGWWGSLNTLSFIGGPITLLKTQDAYLGQYAVRLETKKWGEELTIPGILASGYFDKDLPIGENLVVGKEYSEKPMSFNGYYKYIPQGNDSLVFLVALTKYNQIENRRDTIAQADLASGETVSEYTPFVLFFEYYSQETPDSIHIILMSSINGREMKGYDGTLLIVDELSLSFE